MGINNFMELNQRERTFIGIPNEYYREQAKTKLCEDNIKLFAYSSKVLLVRSPDAFFAEAGQAFSLMRDFKYNVNSCKTYTCLDLDIFDNHKSALEGLDKLQIIALLDIESARNKLKIEGFFRKWFESGRSVILLCTQDLTKLDGYSVWFVDLLKKKSEW